MDNNVLKQTLRDQFEPLAAAVQRKLEYLKSDDVFSLDNVYQQPEMSVEEAFQAFASAQPQQPEERPQKLNTAVPQQTASSPLGQASEEAMNAHKQNIAARIAALRGISLPGDYAIKK